MESSETAQRQQAASYFPTQNPTFVPQNHPNRPRTPTSFRSPLPNRARQQAAFHFVPQP